MRATNSFFTFFFKIHMFKMRRFTLETRARIIGMIEAGLSKTEISRKFNCRWQTVHDIHKKWMTHGHVKDLPRSGRPKELCVREERQIAREHKRDPTRTARETARNCNVSDQTVRRVLKRHGLRSYKAFRGPILQRHHRRKRKAFSALTASWTSEWGQILFTDECRVSLKTSDARMRVYRPRGKRYDDRFIQEYDRWGRHSVMFWAGITRDHRTDIVFLDEMLTAERYQDLILEPHVVPFLETYENTWILQQDNARPHVARSTSDFLSSRGIAVLPWPSFSPDLNPIEHLWDNIKRKLKKMSHQPQNRVQLKEALQFLWLTYPQQAVRRLIDSMPRRMRECVRKRGGHTHY